MKIALDRPDQLVLDDRPWVLGGLLVLLILVFAGFGVNALVMGRMAGLLGLAGAGLWGMALLVFVSRTTVTFDRATSQVTRTIVSFRTSNRTVWSLDELERADIETRLSRSSRQAGRARITPMHRPVLHWTDGRPPLPLIDVYVYGDGASETADAINRWLAA